MHDSVWKLNHGSNRCRWLPLLLRDGEVPFIRYVFGAKKELISASLACFNFRILNRPQLERIWAIVLAHRQGLSVRDIAQQVGLGPTRVHQLVTSPQADCVEHPLSMLREVVWPAPEDPCISSNSGNFNGRLSIAAGSLNPYSTNASFLLLSPPYIA